MLAATAGVVAAPAAGAATGPVVYSSIPSPIPGNVDSWGFEATSTKEFGDEVGLASHATPLASARVLMSSWGCQTGGGATCVTTPGSTFPVPITFKVYAVDNSTPGSPAAGALLTQKTQTFNIPFRPTADPTCPNGGTAWRASATECFNGLATPITFDFTNVASVALPAQVIWTVSYNTTNHGYAPIGAAACNSTPGTSCGYDSLNVGLNDQPNTVGTDTNPDGVFMNTISAFYCDGGPGDTLREDHGVAGGGPGCTVGGDWTGFTPAGELTLAAPPVVTPAGVKANPPKLVGAVPANGGARVNWKGATVPSGGTPITGYVVTPYLGSTAQPAHTFTSTATAQTITGLTNGKAYSFKVASVNSAGVGAQSRASAKATAGAPGKPGTPKVTKGNAGVLKVAYKAPMNNGAVIRTFTATCTSSNGGVTRARSHKGNAPIGVKNLTVGKSYTCTVFATNRRGNGPRSAASAAATA